MDGKWGESLGGERDYEGGRNGGGRRREVQEVRREWGRRWGGNGYSMGVIMGEWESEVEKRWERSISSIPKEITSVYLTLIPGINTGKNPY